MQYSKLIKKTFYNYFFACILILFYLSEGISKYYLYYHSHKLNAPKNIKTVIIILLFAYLIYSKREAIIIKLLGLLLLFIVGQLSLNYDILNVEKLTIIAKYLFPIFFLESAYIILKKSKRQLFFKTFEYLIIFNSLLLLVGFVFDIKLFKTYAHRFGFNGLFITSATSTYFYIIAIFYLFMNSKKSYYFYFLTIITLISSVLVGTKSIFLFLMLLLLFISFYKINKKYRVKAIILAVITISILAFLFFVFEPSYLNFIKERGLLTAILSYRDELFLEKTMPFISGNWSMVNYFFGGINNVLNRSQLGFIDLFLTLGIVGSIVYLYFFYKSLVKSKMNKEFIFFIISMIIIISLGGNFFFSATIVVYLTIIQQIFIKNIDSINE